MTNIIDPSGTVQVVFRDTADTISEISASGSDGSDATQLPLHSARNVVYITSTGSGQGVILPSSAEDGDYWEIHKETSSPEIILYTPDEVVFRSSFNGTMFVRKFPSAWRWWD